jgi:hypothetical protein
MQFKKSGRNAQTALDFIISYAVIILVVTIAIYAVLQLGVFSPAIAPSYCNAAPGFSCTAYSMYTNGTFAFVLTQSLGGTIKITSLGCSSQLNGTSGGPAFGNVQMTNQNPSINYPTNGFSTGTLLLSNRPMEMSVYCFSSPGNIPAKGSLGSTFTGYLFMNYTYSGLPSSYHTIQQVLSFSVSYT